VILSHVTFNYDLFMEGERERERERESECNNPAFQAQNNKIFFYT